MCQGDGKIRVSEKVKNHYKTLGLSNFSPITDIRRSYRKLALIHHPDRGGDADRMKEINEAYDTLMKNKAFYDSQLRPSILRSGSLGGFTIIVGGENWDSSFYGASNTTTSFTFSF